MDNRTDEQVEVWDRLQRRWGVVFAEVFVDDDGELCYLEPPT